MLTDMLIVACVCLIIGMKIGYKACEIDMEEDRGV